MFAKLFGGSHVRTCAVDCGSQVTAPSVGPLLGLNGISTVGSITALCADVCVPGSGDSHGSLRRDLL